jgi:hypothetical protein
MRPVRRGFRGPPRRGRALGLNAAQTPEFTSTPGQVAFTPDGSKLIVTTKGNGNDIDVFSVNFLGGLSAKPVVNADPGAVPFAVSFDAGGHLAVADRVATGQSATCWIAPAGTAFYASNAGSGTLSGYTDNGSGTLQPLGNTSTDPGTVDAAASSGGQYLYAQTGGQGIVDEYRVNAGGSLTEIGSVTVPGAVGGEGIAAS